MKPEKKKGYQPEPMSDDEFLINKKFLKEIKNFNVNKQTYDTTIKGKSSINRKII